MLTNSDIKLINSLKISKHRKEHGLFLVEGPKMLEELLANPLFKILFVAAIPSWAKNLPSDSTFEVKEISEKALQKFSNFSTANEVLAVVHIPEYPSFFPTKEELFLVLDGLQDPGNLGTIIRTAEWFGIKDILCSANTVDCFNPKVVQATMGSIFRVRCHYLDLQVLLQETNLPIYGTLLNGQNIYNQKLESSGFIVVGNESKGISREIQKLITKPLTIPSFNFSKAESLNASVATAIVCAEFRRNQK
ncbi:MAG TPA: RNA methyltransferase [Bacteroidales bacterium]|nr:RNA methyltransferase [Bacteroidales bacterium]